MVTTRPRRKPRPVKLLPWPTVPEVQRTLREHFKHGTGFSSVNVILPEDVHNRFVAVRQQFNEVVEYAQGVLSLKQWNDWQGPGKAMPRVDTILRNVQNGSIGLEDGSWVEKLESLLDEALEDLPDDDAAEWSDDYSKEYDPQIGDLGLAYDKKGAHVADIEVTKEITPNWVMVRNKTTGKANNVRRVDVADKVGNKINMWVLMDTYPILWRMPVTAALKRDMNDNGTAGLAKWVRNRLNQVDVDHKIGRLFLRHKGDVFSVWTDPKSGHFKTNKSDKPFTMRGLKTLIQRWSAR